MSSKTCDIYPYCRIWESTLNVKHCNLKRFLFICKKFLLVTLASAAIIKRIPLHIKLRYATWRLLSLWYSLSQALQGCLLLLVAVNSINSEDEGKLKKIRILNYIAMSFSFGILVADTIKMVFVHDEYYGLK